MPWMAVGVTPLLGTVPPSGGQVGVPTGRGLMVEWHSHKKIPPGTPGCPKWIWAWVAGVDSFVYVSVKESVEPITVASKVPVLGLTVGGVSWKPVSLALRHSVPSSALGATSRRARTATSAATPKS